MGNQTQLTRKRFKFRDVRLGFFLWSHDNFDFLNWDVKLTWRYLDTASIRTSMTINGRILRVSLLWCPALFKRLRSTVSGGSLKELPRLLQQQRWRVLRMNGAKSYQKDARNATILVIQSIYLYRMNLKTDDGCRCGVAPSEHIFFDCRLTEEKCSKSVKFCVKRQWKKCLETKCYYLL